MNRIVKFIFKLVFSFLFFTSLEITAIASEPVEQKPNNNFVPNEQTAIKIAEAIWLPIYGNSIYKHKPFIAHLKDNVWIVEGSLPPNMVGGVPMIEISKSDGRVLRIMHGQ